MSGRCRPAQDSAAYLSRDTIAAVSSALGGAIAIVRASGPDAFGILGLLAAGESAAVGPRQMARTRLLDPEGSAIDDALFVKFANPESYTGEDMVEFHIHGGAFIATRLMETLAKHGARQALPGEFSFRAVRNGKMTLPQAQAVADLIAASNDGAVQLALEKMSGAQNRLLSTVAADLRRLAMLSEAGIDFADQDIDEVGLPKLKLRLAELVEPVERLHSSYARGIRLQEGISVTFVGLPNAGKSSFFNCLLGEDRSIVSEIAGTTRDVIRERITLRGNLSSVTLRLEDTAGLRTTGDVIEKIGIDRAKSAAKAADLVLYLLDPNLPFAAAHEQWVSLSTGHERLAEKTLGIITKCDLLDASRLSTLKERCVTLGIENWTATSALTGEGISAAIQAIIAGSERLVARQKGEILLTRQDQAAAVGSALEHLRRAGSAEAIELFASDIRQALHRLGPLIGETLPDDILGMIFSEFCIGK